MAKRKDKTTMPTGPRTIATNRKARHEYFIEETFEAGVVLTGTEIKSIRMGHVNLQDGFVLVRDGEAMLMDVHIAPYELGNRFNHEETRPRKLLLHKKQIRYLHAQATQRNWTIVPLRLYINDQGRPRSRSRWRAASSCTTNVTRSPSAKANANSGVSASMTIDGPRRQPRRVHTDAHADARHPRHATRRFGAACLSARRHARRGARARQRRICATRVCRRWS